MEVMHGSVKDWRWDRIFGFAIEDETGTERFFWGSAAYALEGKDGPIFGEPFNPSKYPRKNDRIVFVLEKAPPKGMKKMPDRARLWTFESEWLAMEELIKQKNAKAVR